jgi:YVTN family beta-propeller protein
VKKNITKVAYPTIPVGYPDAIAFDSTNGNLYVANQVDNTVSVISGQPNTVIGSPIPVGAARFGIAFDPANGNVYVANFRDNTVSVISGQTNTVIGSPIPVGSYSVRIATSLSGHILR